MIAHFNLLVMKKNLSTAFRGQLKENKDTAQTQDGVSEI